MLSEYSGQIGLSHQDFEKIEIKYAIKGDFGHIVCDYDFRE